MRRSCVGLIVVLLVGAIAFGANLEDWASDGTISCSSMVVVQNPSETDADVRISYRTPGDPVTQDYLVSVPAGGRATVNVNDVVPGPWQSAAMISSDVPIVAAQRFLWSDPKIGKQWAANSGGVPVPSTTWYLAEGTTHESFETYITVRNPGEAATEVELTYVIPGASHEGPAFVLDPGGQAEIRVADRVPNQSSITAIVTAEAPVVAQLSVYWNGGVSTTMTMGVSSPASTWYLAEGNTADWSDFQTWATVLNPGSGPATVLISFVVDEVEIPGEPFLVEPKTHVRVNLHDLLPNQSGFTTIVRSDLPVVAVQSMTWSGHVGLDVTPGVTAPAPQWIFPIARACPGHIAWLVMQEVTGLPADVSLSYVTETGLFEGPTLTLEPWGKGALSLPSTVNGTMDYSVVVASSAPILAQHGAYWENVFGAHRDQNFGMTQPFEVWCLPATPRSPSEFESGGDA